MVKAAIQYFYKQSFQPTIGSILINPFYLIRSGLYKAIRKKSKLLKGRMLDFGCGRKPYRNLFEVSEYIGVDIQQSGHDHQQSTIDVFYDGKTIPFPDNYFDAIFSSEVLEHVFDPEIILPELYRVARPGARILITAPFCWNEHEIPYDYARYSSFGIRHLLEKHGFKVIETEKTGNFIQVCFQLWALYWFELFRKGGKAGYLLSLILIAPINIISLVGLIFPRNQSLYFNNIVIAEK